MKNPLELIKQHRQDIVNTYTKLHAMDSRFIQTKGSIKGRAMDLEEMMALIKQYDNTIQILNELNDKNYE